MKILILYRHAVDTAEDRQCPEQASVHLVARFTCVCITAYSVSQQVTLDMIR